MDNVEQLRKAPVEADEEQEGAAGEKLRSLSLHLAQMRAEYIDGRQQQGIEREWKEDEEYYEGIDAANRSEVSSWESKPMGQAAVEDRNNTGSTIFLNITRPYCDAASAKFGETLMPTDDKAWEINHTPIPELPKIAKGELPTAVKKGIQATYPDDQAKQQEETDGLIRQAIQEIAEAREVADGASRVIEDWHVECQYHSENRILFDDVTKVGVGVLKGPVVAKRKAIAYINGELKVEEKEVPVSKRISYWNLYPDPACGNNIHNGAGVFERDDITYKQLHGLMGVEYYHADQIKEVLAEGPMMACKERPQEDAESTSGLKKRDNKSLFEIWYYHGMLKREDLEACAGEGIELPDGDFFDSKVTMVNNRIIRAVLNPLETGEFPYDVMVWQRREGMPWGMGLSRQIRTCQRMVNAAARNMMNNAGLAGGPQLVLHPGIIEPENDIYEITPLKVWLATEDADVKGIDQAFRFVEVPMMQDKLEAIINLGLKLAEQVTGLPMIMQGQMGNAPDLVGVVNILDNNGSSVMRRIARMYDDMVTEPHLRRYYAYLLQNHEDDNLKKGDMQIDARGSSALVEKAQRNQALIELAKLGLQNDPRMGIDPVKFGKEILRSLRLDPKLFAFDDEEWESMVGEWQKIIASQESAGDTAIQVQQLRNQLGQYVADRRAETEGAKIEMQGALGIGKMELEERLNQADAELELLMKGVDENLGAMKLEGDMRQNMDNIKKDLSINAMKIRETLRLVQQKASADQMPKPPIEPPGQAPVGESYQK